MRRSVSIALAVTALIFLGIGIGIGGALFIPRLLSIGGPRYDPAQPEDLTTLRKLVYSLSPAVEALHARTKPGAVLPDTLKEVSELPVHFQKTFPQLHYRKEGNSFILYYKISWDAFLLYDSRDRTWTYDPGDGSATTVIAL